MADWDGLVDGIVRRIEPREGVQEFKRTIQLDDGSTLTFRVDVTAADAEGFDAAGVRQDASKRVELPPKRFARGDRAALLRWLGAAPG